MIDIRSDCLEDNRELSGLPASGKFKSGGAAAHPSSKINRALRIGYRSLRDGSATLYRSFEVLQVSVIDGPLGLPYTWVGDGPVRLHEYHCTLSSAAEEDLRAVWRHVRQLAGADAAGTATTGLITTLAGLVVQPDAGMEMARLGGSPYCFAGLRTIFYLLTADKFGIEVIRILDQQDFPQNVSSEKSNAPTSTKTAVPFSTIKEKL